MHIIIECGEGEGAAEVRLVTEATTTDVRDVEASFDKMFAMRPGKDFIELDVVFRRSPITLAATASEGVLHDESRHARLDAPRPAILVADTHREFINQLGRDNHAMGEKNLPFAAPRISSGFREIKSADTVILARVGGKIKTN